MILPNARVRVVHIDGSVDENVAVSIQPAPEWKIVAQGGVIVTEMHFSPRLRITAGDGITILARHGHPTPDQVVQVTASNPRRVGGLLPYLCVDVVGVYL